MNIINNYFKRFFSFASLSLGFAFVPIISISASSDAVIEDDSKVTQWVNAPGASDIKGPIGKIFEAKNGDIYALGPRKPLKVLKKGAASFVSVPGTTKENTTSYNGTIFQAKNEDIYLLRNNLFVVLRKNSENFVQVPGVVIRSTGSKIFQAKNNDIYVMGSTGTGATFRYVLAVLKNDEEKFKIVPSAVLKGDQGAIIQAKNEDIYILPKASPLQVLKKDSNIFISAPGVIIGENESDTRGKIFQAKNNDIYAIVGTNLWVLKNNEEEFKQALGANVQSSFLGTIFQAKNEDIYLMTSRSALQVLKKDSIYFVKAPGTNIINGNGGKIFQAKNDDIYAIGYETRLQILEKNSSSFKDVTSSISLKGHTGKIFQAKNGDIYVAGWKSGLEVLRWDSNSFVSSLGTNVVDGREFVIFQAKNGDLYAMGDGKQLQVLEALKFQVVNTTSDGAKDGKIIIKNFYNKNYKIQYKKKTSETWTDIPVDGNIENLIPGEYEFQWVRKDGQQNISSDLMHLEFLGSQVIKENKHISEDKNNNLPLILGISIPVGLISLAVLFLLIKRFHFKN